MSGEPDEEVLKDIYAETGRNFRHFLAWRRLLLAGYFGVLAGVGAVVTPLVQDQPGLVPALPVGIAVISLLFWALDHRNRRLIWIASEAGRNIEQQLHLDGGIYTVYQKRGKSWLTHTSILSVFYLVMIVASLVLALCS